ANNRRVFVVAEVEVNTGQRANDLATHPVFARDPAKFDDGSHPASVGPASSATSPVSSSVTASPSRRSRSVLQGPETTVSPALRPAVISINVSDDSPIVTSRRTA